MANHIIDFFFGVIIPTVKSPYMNFISIGIGWLVHNWSSIDRDKRKEFNAIVEPIRNKFIKFKGQAIPINIPEHDIIDIKDNLPFWQRKRFVRDINEYNKAISQENMKNNGYGGFDVINHELIFLSANNLLKYLNKR